jgi:hypothetical protein
MNASKIMRTMLWLVLGAALVTACQPAGEQSAATSNAAPAAGSGKIVFIRVDSVSSQYEALAAKLEALQDKMIEAEQRQNERITAFQRDVQSFQRRAQSGQMAPRDIGQEQ